MHTFLKMYVSLPTYSAYKILFLVKTVVLKYIYLFPLIFIYAQEYPKATNYVQNAFQFGIAAGYSSPELLGNHSLDILSSTLSDTNVLNATESKITNTTISPSWFIAAEATYQLTSSISIGISSTYRNNYDQETHMLFWQFKQMEINNIKVSSFAEYRQLSKIKNTTFLVTSQYKFDQIQLNESSTVNFEIGIGSGISIYRIKSSIPYVFMQMDIEGDSVSQHLVLGPGQLFIEHYQTTTYSAQLSASLLFNIKRSFAFQIGFGLTHIGNFVILKRGQKNESLFILDSFNSLDQNVLQQELSIRSTNDIREIIASELYLKIYL